MADDDTQPSDNPFDVMNESEEDAGPLIYEDDAINLVPIFEKSQEGRDVLEEVATKVKEDFDTDWEAAAEYRQARADDWKLFAGELDAKTFPFANCANGNVPIMLENITRLQSRVYAEIFADNRGVFGVVPVGPDDEHVARLLSHHGNWQIREKIPDFFRQQMRGLMMFYLNGDVTSHSSWDPYRLQNRHEMLTCDEFVTPYTYVSTMPDYSDVPHLTRVRYLQRHEIQANEGIWHNIDVTLERDPQFSDDPDAPLAESIREVDEIELPDNSNAAPYKILEYEGYLTLPNQVKQRYCRVIYDTHRQNILLLEIREETSWEDRERFKLQSAQLKEYRGNMTLYTAGLEAFQAAQAALTNEDLLPEQQTQVEAEMAGLPGDDKPPPPPAWMENPEDEFERPEPMRMVPIHMYAHGVCIENLTGNLGLGIGRIEAQYNHAANTMLNQFIDASTLSNAAGFIVHQNVEFKDPFEMSPGKIHFASGIEPGELASAIHPIKTPTANPQLLDGVELFTGYGQSAMQSPAVLSGESGKSGETATGLTARIEQATKQTSVSANIYGGFANQIFKNNARLNSKFLSDEEVFLVNNHMGGTEQVTVGKEMYQRNFKVELLSNLQFTTEVAKKQQANETLQMVLGNPYTQSNAAMVYAALVAWLQATGQEMLIPKLGEPPPPPQMFQLPPPPPPEGP